jgi:hypothetical protein
MAVCETTWAAAQEAPAEAVTLKGEPRLKACTIEIPHYSQL